MTVDAMFTPPLTVKEAALAIGSTEGTVRCWLSTRKFPKLNAAILKIGRSTRFDATALQAFIESCKSKEVGEQ